MSTAAQTRPLPLLPLSVTAAYSRWRVVPWSLLGILVVQVVLSLKLVWANTAFQDEALYLWAGHLEWDHWLHGTPVPAFQSSFSGAPVIYPPLGALADSAGGLAAARLLSLACMLGATMFLWDATRRLYGHRAALTAAGIFAVLGPTLHLGSFATYDALSLLLLASASWHVVRAQPERPVRWTLAAAAFLALANMTAYSTVIMDPVVIALTALSVPSRRQARIHSGLLLTYTATFLVAALKIGGHGYVHGVDYTVLDRAVSDSTVLQVLHLGASWAWPALAGGTLGLVCAWRYREWRVIPCALAPVLILTAQAYDRTTISLDKHLDLGMWFAAIAAGYAVSRLPLSTGLTRTVAWAVPLAAITIVAVSVFPTLPAFVTWPNATKFAAGFRPYADQPGRILIETPSVAEYYERVGQRWPDWTALPTGHAIGVHAMAPTAVQAYRGKILDGVYTVIALNFRQFAATDPELRAAINVSHLYRLATVLPYGGGHYYVWVRLQ